MLDEHMSLPLCTGSVLSINYALLSCLRWLLFLFAECSFKAKEDESLLFFLLSCSVFPLGFKDSFAAIVVLCSLQLTVLSSALPAGVSQKILFLLLHWSQPDCSYFFGFITPRTTSQPPWPGDGSGSCGLQS